MFLFFVLEVGVELILVDDVNEQIGMELSEEFLCLLAFAREEAQDIEYMIVFAICLADSLLYLCIKVIVVYAIGKRMGLQFIYILIRLVLLILPIDLVIRILLDQIAEKAVFQHTRCRFFLIILEQRCKLANRTISRLLIIVILVKIVAACLSIVVRIVFHSDFVLTENPLGILR